MTKKIGIVEEKGPLSFENWRNWRKNHTDWITEEYPLFTDAHITGELTDIDGPYQLINMVPESLGKCLAPTLMLRITYHYDIADISSLEKTDDSYFCGGKLVDEIAALLSLQLGVRFKAGKSVRYFGITSDPKGCPQAFEMISDFVLPRYMSRPIVPEARQKHSINDDNLFLRLLDIPPAAATALVRASRMYQEALWICESQPSLAWLFLVSAVETAAQNWRNEIEEPVERMRTSKPDLILLLEKHGGNDLVHKVAIMIAEYMGATKTFIDFLLKYWPAPPSIRPPVKAQLDWCPEKMKKALKEIYDYRSKALHGGQPFPLPMCDSPLILNKIPAEKFFAGSCATPGGVWVSKDLPMYLHVFEYIARTSILKWWHSLIKKK